MPKPYPRKFRDDVVAVARRGEASVQQIASDFGISDSGLNNWRRAADVEDGKRLGVTREEPEQLALRGLGETLAGQLSISGTRWTFADRFLPDVIV
ncbi:MAG: transposase [Actinomycetes bacterium]